jgi:hypothetical protein
MILDIKLVLKAVFNLTWRKRKARLKARFRTYPCDVFSYQPQAQSQPIMLARRIALNFASLPEISVTISESFDIFARMFESNVILLRLASFVSNQKLNVKVYI